jgi:beta-glucosidase
LKKGESKKIAFTIAIDDLKFYNYNLKWIAEPGDFEVMIGTNSEQVNKANFKLLK